MSYSQHRTWIELNRSAFAHNVRVLSELSAPSELGLVIKSNAYGHGLREIVTLAEEQPAVTWLFTAGIEEALRARAAGSTKAVLAMAYLDSDLSAAIQANVDCVVYSVDHIAQLEAAARAVGRRMRVHIKVDTGMVRLGVDPEGAVSLARMLASSPHLELVGIFTHLADVNNPDQSFTLQQLAVFDAVLVAVRKAGMVVPYAHALSSGALLHTAQQCTVTRVGTNVYGQWKSPVQRYLFTAHDPAFYVRPVAAWKSTITQLKTVPEGTTVGYARLYETTRTTVVALVPIGYWDGYPRALSHKSVVLIGESQAPLVGMVSMNFITVDVTDVPDVHVGTEVTLLGGDGAVSATALATAAGTINNELLTNIHADIPRVIVEY